LCIDIYITWLSLYNSGLTIATAQLPENSDFFENLLFLFIDTTLLIIEMKKVFLKSKYGKLHEMIDDYMDLKGLTDLIIPYLFLKDGNVLSLLFAVLLMLQMDKTNKQIKKELKTVIQVVTISSVFYSYLSIETNEIANHLQMVLLLMFILYHIWHLLASIFSCSKDRDYSKGKPLFDKIYDDIENVNIRIKSHSIFRRIRLFVLYRRLKV
jgi:hypothetical protein